LGQFLEVAQKAQAPRDRVVRAIEKAFETGTITLEDGTVMNMTLPNVTLSPAQLAKAKFVYDGINLQEKAAVVVDVLTSLEGYLEKPANEIRMTLEAGEFKCDEVSKGLSAVELRRLQLGFGVPLASTGFFMPLLMLLTAMGLNSPTKSFCTAWCVLPSFALLTTLMVRKVMESDC